MIVSQNPGINTLLNGLSTDEDDKLLDVVAVVPLKTDSSLFKAILRVSNLIRSVIAKQNDKLFIGLQRVCKVYNNFFVLRCFNCQGFRHHSKDCDDKTPTCGFCSSAHETRTCTRKMKMCCANCKRKGSTGESLAHAAFDPGSCPIFMDLQDKVKKTTPFYQNQLMANKK